MKKILLSLFVGLFGFISFGNTYSITTSNTKINSQETYPINKGYCVIAIHGGQDYKFYDNNNNLLGIVGANTTLHCMETDGYFKNETTTSTYIRLYNLNNYTGNCNNANCPTCPTCPDPYTSLECQTEYNLIPIDSVDSAYCENNNLCPVYTGEISTGYSTLFINDIRHESMPFIYVNIPEEFNRTYSTGINDFTIDIEGYNVDTEYIDGIIRTQNYKPSSEDFTNLVGLLAPYTKYLVFLLFVFVVWAWIKKPFKSKKL